MKVRGTYPGSHVTDSYHNKVFMNDKQSVFKLLCSNICEFDPFKAKRVEEMFSFLLVASVSSMC